MLNKKYTKRDGHYSGRPIDSVILEALKIKSMTGTDIYALFQRHIRKKDLQPQLEKLLDAGLIAVHVDGNTHWFSRVSNVELTGAAPSNAKPE